jgi:hydrogenase expression/formation protein HypE
MHSEDFIRLAHGSGGLLSHRLIHEVFLKHLRNPEIAKMDDAAVLAYPHDMIVVSTDSFVVDPIFFPGGDIGHLAVCGTVNDVAVSGGIPQFITVGFILEEGFAIADLDKIVSSMAATARAADLTIIAGDTKVVEKGKGDKIFINTTGIGHMHPNARLGVNQIKVDDHILINGSIAEHGIAILSKREGIQFASTVRSDAQCLHKTIVTLLDSFSGIRFMRDPTRGGVATVLSEIAEASGFNLSIHEASIPIHDDVAAACDMLGIDPLYLANEGKFILFCSPDDSEGILQTMRELNPKSEPQQIGTVRAGTASALLETRYGGIRILEMLPDEILPRIC